MITKENLFFKKTFQTTSMANVCQEYPANSLGFFPFSLLSDLLLPKSAQSG